MKENSSSNDVTFETQSQITQKPLSQRDKKKIKQQLVLTSIIAFFAICLFGAIFYFISSTLKSNDGFGAIPFIMFGIIGLVFAFIIGYMFMSTIKDARSGVKNVIEGIIEDKRLDIKKSSSNRVHGTGARGARSSGSSTKRYYYITVHGTQHKIDYKMFNEVSVGDYVYFEMTPKSGILLDYKLLEKGEKTQQKSLHKGFTHANYPASKIKEAPMQKREVDNLHQYYTQKRNYRLRIMGFLSIPIIGLWYYGFPFLLLFIFPVPIILLYQLYKLIRLYLNYKKSIDSNRKKMITTFITDKTYVTIKNNNRLTIKYKLKTTYKTIDVKEELYDFMNIDEEIILHQPLYLNTYTFGITYEEVYYEN